MPSVFMSYTHVDASIASEIVSVLERIGVSYFRDVRTEVDPVFWTTGRHCLDGRQGRSQRAVWKASQGV